MSTSNLKAYVRYDGSGRVVPGGNILNRFKPKVGNWKEIDKNLCDCCIPLFITSNGDLYTFDFYKGVQKKLDLPGPSISGTKINIMHDSKKLYISSLSGPVPTPFYEWDISLKPFVATYVGTGSIPYVPNNQIYTGATLKQGSSTEGYIIGSSGDPDTLYLANFSDLGAITASPVFTLRTGAINWDLLQTTSGKFITVAKVGTVGYVDQYSSTGVLEGSITLPVSLNTYTFYGVFEYDKNIYIVGSTTGAPNTNNIYRVSFESPYSVSLVGAITTTGALNRVSSASQVPVCCPTNIKF